MTTIIIIAVMLSINVTCVVMSPSLITVGCLVCTSCMFILNLVITDKDKL